MSTIDIVFVAGVLVILIVWIYGSITIGLQFKKQIKRNNDVHSFRLRVLDLCHEYWKKNPHEGCPYEWFMDSGPSYEEMLESNRPLTLDEWYDKGKLERIFEGI